MSKISKTANETVCEALKLLGNAIIDRAEEISEDIKDVSEITIKAGIQPGCVFGYDICKHFIPNSHNGFLVGPEQHYIYNGKVGDKDE